MLDKEFKLSTFNQTFRIKKLNAIEIFAIKTQIDFDNFKSALDTFNLILENVEVKLDDNWLPVKDRSNYYPLGIEDDIVAIDEISAQFMKQFKEVFQKSNASTSKH